MRPLYSDSITTNTKDACHKELTNTSESWSKAIAVWSFTKQSDWTAFCKAPVSKSIKNHIESGLLEQKTWTESRNKTNTPSRRAGTGRFTSSAHNNAIATDRPSTTSWQKKKKILEFCKNLCREGSLLREQMHLLSHPALQGTHIREQTLTVLWWTDFIWCSFDKFWVGLNM